MFGIVERASENNTDFHKVTGVVGAFFEVYALRGENGAYIGSDIAKFTTINDLAIAKKLVSIINKNKDLKAVLTRSGDYYVPLTKRITIAQKEKATMFISIHADAVESPVAKGASVYTLSEKGNNSKLAKQLETSQNVVDQFGGVESVIDSDQFLKNILKDFEFEILFQLSCLPRISQYCLENPIPCFSMAWGDDSRRRRNIFFRGESTFLSRLVYQYRCTPFSLSFRAL